MSAESETGDVPTFSVIVPCFNEQASIEATIAELDRALAEAPPHEVIVVNDGSVDASASILERLVTQYPQLRVVHHPLNRGYGAALKTGIRQAHGEYIAITDADGTYPNERLGELVELCRGRDMVVGARVGENVTYSKVRAFPKFFLKRWVSYIARRPVPDINSGMRVFRKDVSERFFGILPDGFSFTITITLATLTNFLDVIFVPIGYAKRTGKSHIKPVRDTVRFIKIILRTGVYFAPVRAFFPVFAGLMAMGTVSLGYDVFLLENITDKTVMLYLFALNIGMFILIADMIDKRLGSR
ncbi:glycosyltransferase family 2 protein [Sphingomonas sp. Y38-1Y]|uniref:glycosyltransferase family 2 protein n=1 Tax=Sphingomonas sp. Y38-1Y TaxID=3078265 RepID=UPI0028E2C3A5|nr:glycosyltransferase family 2 protein [Sphingomonas sp. Y38-1Y]